MRTTYEFFAGGGMARAGLGPEWTCLFANDIDSKKVAVYRENWGDDHLIEGDVRAVAASQLPEVADLAWASFPCQDLSLAGGRAGLKGERSSTFWPFWNLIRELNVQGRGPRSIVLENVYGALRSHGGRDFAAIAAAIASSGYRFGALIIDAALFVPQSRPRLFIVGVREDLEVPRRLIHPGPHPLWHPISVVQARARISQQAANRWLWWYLPEPMSRDTRFADIIEDEPTGVEWRSLEQTQRLLDMMTPVNRKKVEQAKQLPRRVVGGVYRRTRNGVQRAEVRFDELAGCLRTPAGGSSRQTILVVEGDCVRSRLISSREAARLMGLPDSYRLPTNYNSAYHVLGDGLVVPVVSHIAHHILNSVLDYNSGERYAA